MFYLFAPDVLYLPKFLVNSFSRLIFFATCLVISGTLIQYMLRFLVNRDDLMNIPERTTSEAVFEAGTCINKTDL